jgi:hypothetical protein
MTLPEILSELIAHRPRVSDRLIHEVFRRGFLLMLCRRIELIALEWPEHLQ